MKVTREALNDLEAHLNATQGLKIKPGHADLIREMIGVQRDFIDGWLPDLPDDLPVGIDANTGAVVHAEAIPELPGDDRVEPFAGVDTVKDYPEVKLPGGLPGEAEELTDNPEDVSRREGRGRKKKRR